MNGKWFTIAYICFHIITSLGSMMDLAYGDDKTPSVMMEGDVMIGGLAAIHDAGGVNDKKCQSTISAFGIQRVEAMRYAVHKANERILKDLNFKLGINIRDSCGSETKALDESLTFVAHRVPLCTETNSTSALFGVVGASMSLLTAQVANLLRLFRIPLISYAATSVELSDTTKYDYLLRTVPPDSFQSAAMIDFIHRLNWTSIYILYSAGSYGEHGYESIKKALLKGKRKDYNICIVEAVKLDPGLPVSEIKRILYEDFYKREERIRGIISYCEVPDVEKIVQAIEELKLDYHFRIIGSDNWVTSPKTNESIIFSLHYNKDNITDFYDNWYSQLNPNTTTDDQNPWFEDFWKASCKKVQEKNSQVNLTCDNFENTTFALCNEASMEETCRADDKVPYAIDAVYAYAHAIATYIRRYNYSKDNFVKPNGYEFLEILKKVSFTGVSGKIFFTEDDSKMRGNYDINQFSEKGELVRIGDWKSDELNITSWNDSAMLNFTGSSCQETCMKNEIRVYTTKSCCWTCIACKRNEYKVTVDKCESCKPGQKPNENFTGCYDLPIKHIDTLWETVIITFVAIGVAFTVFTMVTFIRYLNTPLVKASGRELSFILLGGILTIYLIAFSLIFRPNRYTCGVARFGIGLSLCLCYASLLTKTNRIARIFSGRQALSFLTPQWQVTLTMFLLLPQVLIGIIGLVRDEPKPLLIKNFPDYQIIKCNIETQDMIGSIAYIIILVLLCTYYAFKTRKVPANFNEARFIGFVMYTSCVIWVAFIPVVVGTSEEYRTVFIMLDLVINATTLLIGLFGIKLYIILLRPDKNCRTNSKARSVTFFSEGSLGNYSIDGGKDESYEKFSSRSSPVVAYDNNANEKNSIVMLMKGGSSNVRTPKLSDTSNKNGPPHKAILNGHVKKDRMRKSNSLEKTALDYEEKRQKTLTF